MQSIEATHYTTLSHRKTPYLWQRPKKLNTKGIFTIIFFKLQTFIYAGSAFMHNL